MYVTPIRLDLQLNTNQISCCKGKWYVRRFDPDKVENGHIYSSVKEEEVFIYSKNPRIRTCFFRVWQNRFLYFGVLTGILA